MNKHAATVAYYSHSHISGGINKGNEKRTFRVALLTGVTMIVEVAFGYITGSMALLADGWHMGTHTFALGISCSAYVLARKYDNSELFSFGTGKFGILAGYTSALFLGFTALWLIYESAIRLLSPVHIDFSNAILVTVIGLSVNLVSILMLHQGNHHHEHEHHGGKDSAHKDTAHTHHDHNYQSAYFHVIADTLTSLLALVALFSARYLGWVFMDPVMGIVGGLLICKWAFGLLRSTGMILLDGGVDGRLRNKLKSLIEADNDSRVSDLHIWRIDSESMAAIVSVVTGSNRKAEEYHQCLKENISKLTHLSVEVHQCKDCNS